LTKASQVLQQVKMILSTIHRANSLITT